MMRRERGVFLFLSCFFPSVDCLGHRSKNQLVVGLYKQNNSDLWGYRIEISYFCGSGGGGVVVGEYISTGKILFS